MASAFDFPEYDFPILESEIYDGAVSVAGIEKSSRAAGNLPKFEIMEDLGKCPLCSLDWDGCAPKCDAPHPWGGNEGAKVEGKPLTRDEILDRLAGLIEIGGSSSTDVVNCLSDLLHDEAMHCRPDESWVAKLRDIESKL